MDDPVANQLDTFRPEVVGFTSNLIPHPLTAGQDNIVPVTLDIRRDGSISTFNLTIRPELRDLTNSSFLLPAIEVTLHYTYTSTSTADGQTITRRVQYVIPRLGQPAAAAS